MFRVSFLFLIFAARKHQEQSLLVSGLTNRAYSFSHGGRYDAEDY